MRRTIIIGIGNVQRGDDGAGIIAAEKLEDMNIPGAEIAFCGGDAGELMEMWKGFDRAILIDAMRSGRNPGKEIRIEASEKEVPAEIFSGYSTHNFGLGEAVEMARVLGELPKEVIIFGIEGVNFEIGTGISSEVMKGVDEVVKAINDI